MVGRRIVVALDFPLRVAQHLRTVALALDGAQDRALGVLDGFGGHLRILAVTASDGSFTASLPHCLTPAGSAQHAVGPESVPDPDSHDAHDERVDRKSVV